MIGEYSTEQQPEPEPPSFERLLRRYRKDHLKNVLPEIRRHSFFMSKGERRRIAEKKAISRLKRRQARQRQAAQRFIKQIHIGV